MVLSAQTGSVNRYLDRLEPPISQHFTARIEQYPIRVKPYSMRCQSFIPYIENVAGYSSAGVEALEQD